MYFPQTALPPSPIFFKGRNLSAWPGRELQHVSSIDCLEPAFALCALQHIASPSVWGWG